MAIEEQKSIEISYKADIKDLKAKLAQIPNITNEEARKMVAALDRQLKQAEKAAKQSAEASKKAAQQASRAARAGADDFEDLARSAQVAGDRMNHVAEKSGDIDRGFSGVGLALRGVNPQLAEAADGMADTFAVVESLIMGFGALNPIVLAGAAVVGGLALAYAKYSSDIEEAKKRTEAMKERMQELNDVIEAQKDIINNTNSQFGNLGTQLNDSAMELAVLRGEMTEFEAATMRATFTAEQFRAEQQNLRKTQIGALQTTLDARREEEKIMRQQIAALESQRKLEQSAAERWAGENPKLSAMGYEEKQLRKNYELLQQSITADQTRLDESKQQIFLINEQANQLEKNLQAIEAIKNKEKERTNNYKEQIAATLQLQRLLLDATLEDNEKAIQAVKNRYEDEQQAVKELGKLSHKRALADQVANELRKKEVIELADLELAQLHAGVDAEMATIKTRTDLQKQLANAKKTDQQNEIDAINERYRLEFAKIEEMGLIANDEQAAVDLFYERRKEQINELHALEMAKVKERRAEYFETANTIVGAFGQIGGAIENVIRNRDALTQDSLQKLFRLQQAAAIADIAMETAKNVVAVAPNPLAMGAMAAVGVAQSAVVLSQKPPKLHMGGMAPDEAQTQVLTGEAVLDRTTVRNMGGDIGVRRLQNNANNNAGPSVVVLNPFMHFDRYFKYRNMGRGQAFKGAY
jgi:hypothetical protein